MPERSPLPLSLSAPDPGPVVYFAPHPDDDMIGAGGTLALHREQGDRVHVVIAYDGAKGQMGDERIPDQDYVALREAEARRGGGHLGLLEYRFLRYPEGHLPDPVTAEAAVLGLTDLILELAPHTIYAPWIGEHQIDHHVLAQAVARAARAAKFQGSAWGYDVWTPLVPTRVVDVTRVWTRVLSGLREHASQTGFTDLEHHASGLAAHRALYLPKGARFGEGFRPLF